MADFTGITGGGVNSTGKTIVDPNYNDLRGLQKYRLQQNGKIARVFSINDYKWGEHNTLNYADTESVQKIILEEFQPDPVLDIGRMIDVFLNKTTRSVEGMKTTTGTIPTQFGNFIGNSISSAIQGGIGWVAESAIMANYLANPESVIKFPIELIKKMIPGKFLNRYELPFFERTYLDTTNSGSWSTQGSTRVLGSALHKIFQENMNVDFPTAPTWTCGDNKGKDFKFDLYLINDNTENLIKNFRFLHSLISGTFWIQLSVLQKSPNLYRVTVPGRFIKYFCAMGINCEMVGKLRTNSTAANTLSVGINNGAISSSTLFPDAYKLDISIQDLTPNHFNNYINYMINNELPVDMGQVNKMISTVDVIKEVSKQTVGNVKKTEDELSKMSEPFNKGLLNDITTGLHI